MSKHAFTLIELLVVVAIISILSAIALPNFLDAQIRAKVSRVHAEMYSIAVGIEQYVVEYNRYPMARVPGEKENLYPMTARLKGLTTPVAYMTSLPPDVFAPAMIHASEVKSPLLWDTYDYFDEHSDRLEAEGGDTVESTRKGWWRLASAGPDLYHTFGMRHYGGIDYDPTNGTVSAGDIVRRGSHE